MPFYKMLRQHVKPISSLKSRLPLPTLPVPANEKLLAWVGDEIVPRESAKVLLHQLSRWNSSRVCSHLLLIVLVLTIEIFQVSVFDSVVQGGDAVWEGLRIYKGKIFKLEEHLDRSVKRN